MRTVVRRSIALLSVVTLMLGVSALRSPAAMAAGTGTCTQTVTVNYTVQVCLTEPAAGAVLTGDTTVSATQSVLQGNASVARMVFTVDNQYVLSAFTAPYTFTWHTARHWVDGPHTLGVYARMSDNSDTSSNAAAETVTLSNGVATTPVNNNSRTPTTGTAPAAGQPEIVGAVGSGADGRGANTVASEVAGWSPNLFLYLGDVYEQGSYEEFDNWYDPSWGPMRGVTNPVPGDQEVYYGVGGYTWYWNNLLPYYSYDVAGWHFIALTQCAWSSRSFPPNGQCGASSPQLTWLNNDLAAHPGACTIAYWHEPRFALDGSGGSTVEQSLWGPLANSHATMAVNADRHNYERWTAMDANGTASATGMAEFVVGTGNHNWEPIVGSDSRTLKTIVNTPGALKLSLTTTTAGFQFIGTDGAVGDLGNIPCQGNGTLAGTVTDSGSGAAIAGATVSYSGMGPAGSVTGNTTTDGTGRYSFPGIAVTSYSVTAQASGHQGQSATATVGGGSTTTQNFALTGQATQLSGTVTDASTGNAIAGATVSAGSGSAVTDAGGAYTISGLAPGTYTATATASGYASQSASVTLTTGSTTTQNFALAPNPGTITGTVTDAGTAAPIAGATVSYSGGSTSTDGSGAYTLANVAEGSYTVTAGATGYASQSRTVTVGPGATATQNFALTGQVTRLSGTVTDASTGKPIAGAAVSAGSGSAVNDAGGAYAISGLAPGTYTATASASGYASQSASVTLTAGNTTTQNFALAPNPGTITGTVTDAGTGAPIAGAAVSYSGGSTSTDGSGAYTLANVAEGSYTVTASATGYASQNRTVTVGPGATATQNFALTRPNGAITGTVTSAATGSPIGGATVSYSGGSTTTNGSGQYTLSNVATGTYNVSASAAGYSSASQSITVGSGQTATANFALRLAPLFSDGFESGTLSNWTTSAGLTVQTATVHSGTYAAEGSAINGTTYAIKQLNSTYADLYYRAYVNIKSQTTGFTLMADQTAGGAGIIHLYVNPQGQLVLWNDITQLTTTGPTLSAGSWHSVELHVVINGVLSTTEVWLDGAIVPAFSSTMATLGVLPVGQVQLGSQAMLQIYDVAFDDAAVSTSRIGQ